MSVVTMRRKIIAGMTVILSYFVWGSTASAQVAPAGANRLSASAVDSVVRLAKQRYAEARIPGGVIGIWHKGHVQIFPFGVTSAEDSIPVTAHTVFPIASITKTFIATAIMRLVDQGLVDLNAPVQRYLPDFVLAPGVAAGRVTVAHLLTHMGGWFGQLGAPDAGVESTAQFAAQSRSFEQLSEPGSIWGYNNAGFNIAGRVIEVVTKKPIAPALRDLVLGPLRLEHAGTDAGDFITHRFALGHQVVNGSAVVSRPYVVRRTISTGGVGVCMSDLMQYAGMHLRNGQLANGDVVLKPATAQLMRAPRVKKEGNDEYMGVGWHLRDLQAPSGTIRTAAHGGSLIGHTLLLELVPEHDLAIGIFSNVGTSADTVVPSAWRVIEEVERTALKLLAGASLAPNAAIGHRGIYESVPDPRPLARQPDPNAYVGAYRFAGSAVTVRKLEGDLSIAMDRSPGSLAPHPDMRVRFIGPDRAIALDSPSRGQSVEFLRDSTGAVRWMRLNGRIVGKVP